MAIAGKNIYSQILIYPSTAIAVPLPSQGEARNERSRKDARGWRTSDARPPYDVRYRRPPCLPLGGRCHFRKKMTEGERNRHDINCEYGGSKPRDHRERRVDALAAWRAQPPYGFVRTLRLRRSSPRGGRWTAIAVDEDVGTRLSGKHFAARSVAGVPILC